MDIDKAKDLKRDAENKILGILKEFCESTGVVVDGVTLEETFPMGAGRPVIMSVSIRAWLYP